MGDSFIRLVGVHHCIHYIKNIRSILSTAAAAISFVFPATAASTGMLIDVPACAQCAVR